jgi:hypothetical protein
MLITDGSFLQDLVYVFGPFKEATLHLLVRFVCVPFILGI